IEQYEELVRRGATNPSTHGNLAAAYAATGQTRRGLEIVQAYLRRYPESAAALHDLGEALVTERRIDEARAAFEKASTLNPRAFGPRLGRWNVAVLQNRWDEAAGVIKELAAAANPFEHVLSGFVGAGTSVARGRGHEALTRLDRIVRGPGSAPEDRAAGRLGQATLLLRQKNAAAALAQAEQAQGDARNTGQELRALALLAMAQASSARQTDADRTLTQLESRAKVLPGPTSERMAQWARGEIARARGDRITAAAELAKAQSALPMVGPVNGPPSMHSTLWFAAATANLDAGRDDEATRLFERLQSGHERVFDLDAYARSFYLLAGIYERRGDTTRARDQYTRFLDLWRDGDMERGWVAEAIKKTAR
ncbi:MAG TPA: tetratricopeptide repeat protein, partial [Vicinamibacterales bacterium]